MMKLIPLALLGAVVAAPANAALINGGFEAYGVPAGGIAFPLDADSGGIPGWRTTATDNAIEIWGNGFNGVPAFEGVDFAELNATQVSTLFQDVAGIPAAATIGFQFAHRGRAGVDTMRLTITDLGADNVFGGGDDSVLFTNTYSDGTAAWGFYTGTGITALGNSVRFAYEAVSAAGGPTVGNFLDDVDFGVGVGEPVPAPGGLAIAALGLAGLAAFRRRAR